MTMDNVVLTERQRKYFETLRANFETNTGKPMADWLEIMKTCPETKPRAQMAWLKAEHGVGQNSASFILDSLRPGEGMGWDSSDGRADLWKDPGSLAILEAVEGVATGLDGVISGQRKSFTSFSRAVQFAAARPLKGGGLLLGLKLDPAVSPRLAPAVKKESWSERLSAVIELTSVDQVDADLADLFAQAAAKG